ncbi:MAG: hypothetical protein KAV82_09910, partial [Phycisphaerae bacterium]|nr:hypothetical protein [Phycisphaerae bacterium]
VLVLACGAFAGPTSTSMAVDATFDAAKVAPQKDAPPKPVTPDDFVADQKTGSDKDTKPKTEGGQPKLVYEAQIVTLEPSWAGKPLQPTWVIKNEGDADLTIKVRGG